jgi:energy-coupling factor transporter ATP-binding protein EcfA2
MLAPIHSPHLNLFVASDDTRRYVPRPATEEALAALEQRITVDREETTLLVGPPGIGKSMLLRVLVSRLRRTLRTVTLGAGDIDAPTLCAFVLAQLRLEASNDPEQSVLLLAAEWSAKRSALVIAIDAAERLPLATAGRLGALAMTAGGGMRIVAAAPEPATELARALGCQAGAVALRTPMTLHETQAHLQAALAAGHAPPEVRDLFTGLTVAQIFRESHGLPSDVNALAAERLAVAVADGAVAEPGRSAWGRPAATSRRSIVSI